MKKLVTLLLIAACFTASAQIEVEYPYNPDNQNDGHVGIEDILEILTVYGEEFTPEQLMVEGTSLTEWIQLLSETVIQQQAQIDSLQGQLSNFDEASSLPWGIALGERVFWDLDSLDWQTVDFPSMDFAMIEAESDGLLHVSGNTSGYNPYRLSVIPEELLPCDDMSQCDGMLIQALFAGDEFEEFQYVDLWANDNALPLTIPIKKGELVCLRRESLTASWQRFIWTPFISSATEAQDDQESESQIGPCQGEFTVNYHGYDYELVEIGDQCWFAEDLVSQSFSDDSPVTFVEEEEYDATDPSGPVFAHCEIEGNGSFGLLYNWLAISDDRGLCPSGWHTSTKQEWESLVSFIETNFLVTTQGALKSKTGWVNAGANHLGFNAKPSGYYGGGYCYSGWAPNNLGLWTTSEIDANGDIGTYRFSSNSPLQYTADCSQGFCVAVRCVKD